MVILFLPLFK
jgi:choice-of-anchor A domain-containing protein